MGKTSCCDENGLKKGPWTTEEDKKLTDYIHKHGHGKWRTLPKNAGLKRCGKSCRLRWTNYLRPDIKRGKFSLEEEDAIIQLHKVLGNKWSVIAARLPGRTDNEIKNFWNTHIKKRLLTMGIDPVTHMPRISFLELASLLSSSLYNTSQHLNINKNVIVESEKSEQLDVNPHTNFNSCSLGFGPIANQSLLNLVTSLLSSSSSLNTNPVLVPQCLQENHQTFPENQEPASLPDTSLWQNSDYGEIYSLGYENGNYDSMVENQREFMSDNGFGLAPYSSAAQAISLNNNSSSSSKYVNGGIEDVIRLCNY